MRHELKIKELYYYRLEFNKKHFEVRKNDRDFQVGDTIRFTVVDNDCPTRKANYFGLPDWKITYIYSGLGMVEGYVVLELQKKNTNDEPFGMSPIHMGINDPFITPVARE
jgi:DNA-directed RNA polymerase subunit E'/Rpb7